MTETAPDRDDFADAFESAFARLQVAIEAACAAEDEWPAQVVAGIRAAFAFAASDPASARLLTSDALAAGREGWARYERLIAHYGERLLPGRAQSPDGRHLPEITERAMIGGLATFIAQRLDRGKQADLPAAAPDAIQFVLTPYLGAEQARRVAAHPAPPS